MTEYRRITADDLTAEPMAVEVYSRASGEWIPMTAQVATLSGGAEFIKTTNAAGGGQTYPKGHGLLARVAVEPAPLDARIAEVEAELAAEEAKPRPDRHAIALLSARVGGLTEARDLTATEAPSAHDTRPCTVSGEHRATTRHTRTECPTTPAPRYYVFTLSEHASSYRVMDGETARELGLIFADHCHAQAEADRLNAAL